MRLREANVVESSRKDVLWHSKRSVTDHYSMAQIRELHDALEKLTQLSNGWNKSLQALKGRKCPTQGKPAEPIGSCREYQSRKSPAA